MIGRASDRRSDPLIVNTVSFLQNKCSHFKQNNQVGASEQPGSVTLYGKDRHPLLLERLLPFHMCIRMIGSASDRIFDPLVVDTVFFPVNNHSYFKQNNQFWAPEPPRKCDTVL